MGRRKAYGPRAAKDAVYAERAPCHSSRGQHGAEGGLAGLQVLRRQSRREAEPTVKVRKRVKVVGKWEAVQHPGGRVEWRRAGRDI